MTRYNPAIHHRRSIRLKGYDYAKEGLYFITLCCQNKYPLFGEIIAEQMHLNEYGWIAHDEWLKTQNIRSNCLLHEFIIMPDHMHGIIEIIFNNSDRDKNTIGKFRSPSQTIGSIIRGYKIATIKQIKNKILSDTNAPRTGESPIRTGELQFAPIGTSHLIAQKKIISLDLKIWQRDYYDIIIKDERAYINISNYIKNNPKNWKKKKFKKSTGK